MQLRECSICHGVPIMEQRTLTHGRLVATYIEVGCPGKCAFVQVRVRGSTVKDIEDTRRKAEELWNRNAL